MTQDIDPITLAVLAGRMEQIADEMDATLFRAAFNPIIAEAHDASHGLYHAVSGDTLVQGKSGLPIFVGVMSFAVKAVIDKAAENGDLEDGDIYIFNDAHLGGTHLSDMRLVRPYFHDGELFCYLASVGHWHDVGGAVPGNYNPAATDAFQEAFVLPPVRLAKAGKVQTDIIDILMRNTRLPQSAQGDLNGQLGALRCARRTKAARSCAGNMERAQAEMVQNARQCVVCQGVHRIVQCLFATSSVRWWARVFSAALHHSSLYVTLQHSSLTNHHPSTRHPITRLPICTRSRHIALSVWTGVPMGVLVFWTSIRKGDRS